MNRRDFLKTSSLALATVSFTGCNAAELGSKTAKKPNLIYVFPDQWRGQALGFLKEEPVTTPNIDNFASQSLVLTDAVSNYPVCVPYRGMLMSGQYPHTNGVVKNNTSVTETVDTRTWWSDILKANGYNLGYFGKWHITQRNTNGNLNNRHGFDHHYILDGNAHMKSSYNSSDWPDSKKKKPKEFSGQAEYYSARYDTENTLKFLKHAGAEYKQTGKPFAAVVSYNPPHMSYTSYPEKYKELLKDVDVEELCKAYPNIPPKGSKWGDYYRRNIKGYYRMIFSLDKFFGRLMQCLKEMNLEEDTIVVFTSDHGDCLGRHGAISKNQHYEEAMRVPFIIRWPGKIKPRHDDLLISVPDNYPTLLELLGLGDKTPSEVQGVSHAPLFLTGKGHRPSSQLYLKTEENVKRLDLGRRGVRTHRYTLRFDDMENGTAKATILHDNPSDPFQMVNIAEDQPETVRDLVKTELIPWLKRTNDPALLHYRAYINP
jgi:arylsulfatase A-like enzyme